MEVESETNLSLVSNVRKKFLDHESAVVTEHDLVLTEPDLVLDSWRENYTQPITEVLTLYTTLHGKVLDTAIESLFSDANHRGKCMFGSFSAARWIAPYVRTNVHAIFRLPQCVNLIEECLEADRSGANISVQAINDTSVFKNALESKQGVICTSPIQTYLDLYHVGDRGREVAEFLRQRSKKWTNI